MNTTTNISLNPHCWRYQRTATAAPAPPEPQDPDRNPGDESRNGRVSVPLGRVVRGDALTVLRTLPAGSFDCVITSPPYHLLRRYGGGDQELGTEIHVDDYVNRLVEICDEIARVLTPTGTLFLNLGDSFSRGRRFGAPAKSMLLAPERLLLKLIERDWRLRNRVVWAKRNGMPNSVADRFSTAWEPLYFLVRANRYYFDLDRVRQPHTSTRVPRPYKQGAKYGGTKPPWAGILAGANDGLEKTRAAGRPGHQLGKNPGDVIHLATAAFRGAHFAVFPEALVTRPLLAGCPERVCTTCTRPWEREKRRDHLGDIQPTCRCPGAPWRPGRVLDPFMGSGTVGVVAEQHGRDWAGIELNPAFAAMAETRIAAARQRHNNKETSNERNTP